MAKKTATVTKSDAMRQIFADGIDKPTEVSAEARKRFGLDVNPAYVSSFKSGLKTTKKAKKKKGAKKTAGSLNGLHAAVEFIKSVGSVEAAREALDIVEEIRNL